MIDQILQQRAGGRVERCHGVPHHGSYSNAAHSWGVAMLMRVIWPEDFQYLAIYCLSHDIPEAWVGDIPAPTLRYIPELRDRIGVIEDSILEDLGLPRLSELEEEDLAKLRACDQIELYLWARDQLNLGNIHATEIIKELMEYWEQNPLPERARDLIDQCDLSACLPSYSGVMKRVTLTSG